MLSPFSGLYLLFSLPIAFYFIPFSFSFTLSLRSPPSPPLALGTLPYIDNFANIGGFFFGIVSAFVLVPYISIGKWDRVKKFTIVTIFFPTLVFMFLVVIFFFYVLPDPSFCNWCSYINCIPYTETFCDDFLGNVQNFVPTVPAN